jgi:hypothetical protein
MEREPWRAAVYNSIEWHPLERRWNLGSYENTSAATQNQQLTEWRFSRQLYAEIGSYKPFLFPLGERSAAHRCFVLSADLTVKVGQEVRPPEWTCLA